MNRIYVITFCCFILFTGCTGFCRGGTSPDGAGARMAGLSMAGTALSGPWAIMGNQAGFAGINNISAGIYYENHFLLKETGTRVGYFILPTRTGNFGITVSSFGFNLYNETRACLSYAKKLGGKFSVGINLNYLHRHIGNDYPDAAYVSFDAGLQTELAPSLILGAHVSNPLGIYIDSYHEKRPPPLFRLGMAWLFSDQIILSVQADKKLSSPLNIRCGTEIKFHERFFIRAGVTSNPFTNSIGAGFRWNRWMWDIAGSVHYILGYSLQVSLQYGF